MASHGRIEDKILKGLEDIGYSGPLLKSANLQSGPKDVLYTTLVSFLTNEIRTLLGIDEEVNAIASPEDSVSFVMEITSFLKELNCPYKGLIQGHLSERLQTISDRLLLVDYLITELMAARILQEGKPEKIEIKLQETPEGADMRLILQTLRFPKPPANISVQQLFDKLDTTVPIVLKKAGADLIGQGIFNGFLSDKQWEILKGVQADLSHEYKLRREMMLTRLDVTIQSFQWSDRTKDKDELFEKVYHEKRRLLKVEPDVDISDLIASRMDLAIIEKTSSASVRKNTKTPLNKVIIGQVPDRGGRSWEQAPPPPEMPSWQQNRSSGPMTGGRGGGGVSGGGRGGAEGGDQSFSSRGRGGGYQGRGGYQNKSFDNNGGYQNKSFDNDVGYSNRRGGNNRGYDNRSFDNRSGYSGGSGGGYDYRSRDSYNNFNRRDSGGSQGQEYQQNKRPKTYDSFQANKQTYTDQYVQDNQHNQQYHRGGGMGRGGFQRGRSSYQRGGGYR
ncbi:protein FAM98A [Cylas formicarius]|uniref:protein FAM98A n=1 Tax=Cylas formicarius TaxID=197179 RepID=UPI0029585989|nr:protein FAM98A [Cylas formicarius]